MREQIVNGHKLVFFDNVEDLPITQFHKYSKFLLVEGGIGDTIADIDRHIQRIFDFIDDRKKLVQEVLNLRQCLYVVATEQDISSKATLCLVHSVDGERWEDFSDSGLDKLYELVKGASLKELTQLAKKVREAIDNNLLEYFPLVFEDSVQKNYTDLLRKRALLQITSIVKGEDKKEEIESIDKRIHSMHAPKGFMGSESEEIRFDKQFEDMCLLMAKEFGGGIKKFTTMEFYTAYERLTRQYKEMKKLSRKK